MPRYDRRRANRLLTLEPFEPRIALHFDGEIPADAPYLTLSFAPDGTAVGGEQSRLFALMDRIDSTTNWQGAILAAFQTWARETNGDVGRVDDGGQALGTDGSLHRDPRFGDIRIGAIPMRRSFYAVSIPRSITTGTWASDVIFNSNLPLAHVDEIFRVALHEAGHVFGLGESQNANSPMYYQGIPAVSTLDPTDKATLHTLSGSRGHDGNEPNDGRTIATHLYSSNSDFDGQFPLIHYGDVQEGDVDDFVLNPLPGATGTVTFAVRSLGISQLSPTLEVYDRDGTLLGSQASSQSGGDIVSLTLPITSSSSDGKLYPRIRSQGSGNGAIGGYSLMTTLDSLWDQQAYPVAWLNELAGGGYRFLDADDIQDILEEGWTQPFPYLNDDLHQDDSLVTATELDSMDGFVEDSQYEVVGSLSDATDVDFYQIESPESLAGSPSGLIITLEGLDAVPITARAELLSEDGELLATEPVIHLGRRRVVQTTAVAAEQPFYLRVIAESAAGANPLGNYRLTARFGKLTHDFQPAGLGQLSPTEPSAVHPLASGRDQLLTLAFRGRPDNADRQVRVEILNDQGAVVLEVTAPSREYRSSLGTLIPRGPHQIRVRFEGPALGPGELIEYELLAAKVIDPLAVALRNTAEQPIVRLDKLDVPLVFVFPGRPSGEASPTPVASPLRAVAPSISMDLSELFAGPSRPPAQRLFAGIPGIERDSMAVAPRKFGFPE